MSATRRKDIPATIKHQILMEAGYKCGNPACRNVITLHLHHIVWVTAGGPDESSNLLALCPYCHAMHHAGHIPSEAIRHWKGMLHALNSAFSRESMDLLIFLNKESFEKIWYSGDAVLRFAGLIAAGLVEICEAREAGGLSYSNGSVVHPPSTALRVQLSQRGKMLVDAWIKGDEGQYRRALETKEASSEQRGT